MFLGKEGAGKTSCVNAMLGKAFNAHEPSTDGIVTTTVFQTVGEEKWEEQKDVDECELTKELRDQAIAANIAKKLKQSQSQQNISKSAPLSASDPGRTSSSGSSASSMVTTQTKKRGLLKTVMQMPMILWRKKGQLHVPVSHEKKLPEGIHNKLFDVLADQSAGHSNVGPSDLTRIWDYAGQLTYYITHRFFLTDGSSYGVVFSLLDDLDALAKPRDSQKGLFEMTNLEMNVFWIRSIYEHAVLPNSAKKRHILINNKIASPPISIIGTHMDQLSGSEEEKQTKIQGIFNRIFDEIKGTPYEKHVDREMYVVDNTTASDKGIEKLKKNVGGYMKAMAKTVPINWVDFQSKVQAVGKTRVCMSLDEITKIAVECGISNENTIHVLNYLNDLGIILYSPTNKKLKNTVITNIHMLIGIFMKIITVVEPDDSDKAVPVMMQYWRKLDEEGILAEQLLHYLWRNELTTGKDDDVFEVFLELMKTFGLLFEKNKSQEGTRLFVVPSRMKTKTENLEVKKDEVQTVSIYVTPNYFLPDAVYDVLVVRFVNLSQDKGCVDDPKKLFHNQSQIGFDDKHYLTLGRISINNKKSLKLEISRMTEKNQHGVNKPVCKPHPNACMEVLHVLKQHLAEVYPSKECVGYALQILCPVCSTPGNQPHFQELEKCLKNELMTCEKTSENMPIAMSTAQVQNLFIAGKADEGVLPNLQQPLPIFPLQGISDSDFGQLLVDISEWYDRLGYINMLKVLYRDHLNNFELDSATDVMGLLNLLIVSGNLSSTNLTILYDTVKVTNQFGFKSKIKNQLPQFQNREIVISTFTQHRQKLLKLGMDLTQPVVVKLDGIYNIPLLKKYKDSWSLLMDLEHRMELSEGKLDKFIELVYN